MPAFLAALGGSAAAAGGGAAAAGGATAAGGAAAAGGGAAAAGGATAAGATAGGTAAAAGGRAALGNALKSSGKQYAQNYAMRKLTTRSSESTGHGISNSQFSSPAPEPISGINNEDSRWQ